MLKTMSKLTAHQFTEAQGALGMTGRELSLALGKHDSTIASYRAGRYLIPNDVAAKLNQLLQLEATKIANACHMTSASIDISSMITYQNQRKRPLVHTTEARFMRRQLPVSTKTLPPYRLTRHQWTVYVTALAAWAAHVRKLAQLHAAPERQRDYQLELADLRAMASCAPHAMPYDVVIQVNEWDVVSRALRHHSKTDPYAFSLYQSWRRNRGAGSYLNYRAAMIAARQQQAVQPIKNPESL